MSDDEKFVREHWDWVHCCDGSYQGYPRGTILTQSAPGGAKDRKEFSLWSAAAAFTRDRLERIREVEEEIMFTGAELVDCQGMKDLEVIIKRILARETAALIELKRGMKQERTG